MEARGAYARGRKNDEEGHGAMLGAQSPRCAGGEMIANAFAGVSHRSHRR